MWNVPALIVIIPRAISLWSRWGGVKGRSTSRIAWRSEDGPQHADIGVQVSGSGEKILLTLWQFGTAESIVERMSEQLTDGVGRRLRAVAGWLERVLVLGLPDGGPGADLESVFAGRAVPASVGCTRLLRAVRCWCWCWCRCWCRC